MCVHVLSSMMLFLSRPHAYTGAKAWSSSRRVTEAEEAEEAEDVRFRANKLVWVTSLIASRPPNLLLNPTSHTRPQAKVK